MGLVSSSWVEERSYQVSCQPANKQLQRTVERYRGRAASASFHYALAARYNPQRAAAELRRYTARMAHRRGKCLRFLAGGAMKFRFAAWSIPLWFLASTASAQDAGVT